MLKHFEENKEGIDYVAGDIHGCFDKLQAKLDEIGFCPEKDRLFSVGDLVDSGTQSEESLDWIAKPWFHAVRGNHEQMAIDYVQGYGDEFTYLHNGGGWFIRLPKTQQKLFAEVFSDLPIAIDVPVGGKLYGVIHADCPTEDWGYLEDSLQGPNKESFETVAMWDRDRIRGAKDTTVDGVELLYVGHTPLKEVTQLENVVYIDTGAVFGSAGSISVVRIGDNSVTVDNRKEV